MNEFLKWAQALLGPAVPVAAIGAIAVGLGHFLDSHLKPTVRSAYLTYLREGRFKDGSHAVVDAAADAMNIIFGPRHLSWRCFFASAAVTISSIVLLVALSGIFSFWISSYLDGPPLAFLKAYWLAEPISRLKAALSWMIWSIPVDYVALYKTRLVIRVLRRHTRWGPLVCLGDFMAGFTIYVAGVSILSLLPLLLSTSWISPPAVSFEMAMVFMFIMIWWARAHVPGLEGAGIAQGLPADQVAALLHGDIPQTVLGMAFLVQLIPFVTIGSDLFYASMMPSIWLWLFVASVFIAKIISGVGAYLQFVLTRFRKPKRTVAVTGTILIPVMLAMIYVVTLLPYILTGVWFAIAAVLGLIGVLGEYLPAPLAK
ncbi:hypothetical protein ACQKQD_18010 [Methylobacterium sp. NPDC080182]|uniref:hypothetical protein n=1 Tax=Methylobacterium sp. NPDC080182 TaxID=3390590 RepID=UPI003D084CAC